MEQLSHPHPHTKQQTQQAIDAFVTNIFQVQVQKKSWTENKVILRFRLTFKKLVRPASIREAEKTHVNRTNS